LWFLAALLKGLLSPAACGLPVQCVLFLSLLLPAALQLPLP
jgi:hypothetical protein